MNFLPSLSSGWFAVAGLLCAAGPIMIHLLNRRRFRKVPWAAMDFLREALRRSRKILELRDMLLLLLRTLAVLLFALALAQPFISAGSLPIWTVAIACLLAAVVSAVVAAVKWSQPKLRWAMLGLTALLVATAVSATAVLSANPSGATSADASQSVHAVLLIDNSHSMGYESAWQGSLLQQAKQRARAYVQRLPQESRVSIVPLCGSRRVFSSEPYTKADSLQAMDQIEIVDRSTSIAEALLEAQRAFQNGPNLPRRVVLLSDQQAGNWQGFAPRQFDALPEIQVVNLSGRTWDNAWIADLRVEDGLADVETATTLIVELQYSGGGAYRDVEVKLAVEGDDVAVKTVRLQRDMGARQVRFQYVFDAQQLAPGQSKFVDVQATITPDNLPADDTRHLIVPVVASLPVVFVDRYGNGAENPRLGRLGETRALRKLLAPGSDGRASRLLEVRHLTIDQLDRDALKSARLVVIAGISDPRDKTPLLREYVEQGGQLIVAAGGEFQAALWNAAAWLDGAGILAAPLTGESIGTLPEDAPRHVRPFFLAYESLASHYYFQLADTSQDELRELFSTPFFFKAVSVDVGDEVLQQLVESQTQRLGEDDPASRDEANWLLWSPAISWQPASELADGEEPPAELAQRGGQALPQVLARFDVQDEAPYLVERRIGLGSVLLVASGVGSSWNTLHTTNAMLVFDRILRSMIHSTLPQRNFPVQQRITLPLEQEDRSVTLSLDRPGQQEEPEILETGFIGRDRRGFTIMMPLQRGLYRVTASRTASFSQDDPSAQSLWNVPLAVNGPVEESQLAPLSRVQFDELTAGAPLSWVDHDQEIALAGPRAEGRSVWHYLMLLVLVLLMVEMAMLAWPTLKTIALQT